jgi:REP element-mobilizing transposase RayT
MAHRSRATARLLPGRISAAGANYFLTWCTHNRTPNLTTPAVSNTLRNSIAGLDHSHDGVLFAATIMPDHVHMLLSLGTRLTVSQIVAKLKAAVTRAHSSVQWQLNFFEHRLRHGSVAEDFAFYVFMNPYTAGLCGLEHAWPGWMPSQQIRWSFEDKLREGGLPQAEWLLEAERFAQTLPAGAD